MDLVTRLESIAARPLDKPAFISQVNPERWEPCTFRQLLDKTNRFMRGLQGLGLQAGQRVAVMVPPGPDYFALAIALLKTGLISIIVSPAVGLTTVTACFETCRPDMYIGNGLTHAVRRLYGWGHKTVRINTSLSRLLRIAAGSASTPASSAPSAADSPAAIIYTSGSTGPPKGAVYTQGNLAAQLDKLAETFQVSPEEIDLPAFPLFALIDCLLGVTAIIPDEHFPAPARVDPEKIIGAINRFHVSNMFASPVVLDKVATYGAKRNLRLPSLKRVITAGAPAPVPALEAFWKLLPADARLFGIYGATEVLPITVIDSQEILTETCYATAQGAGICLGRPVKDTLVRVIEISDAPIAEWQASLEVKPHVVGEITVTGPTVTQTYVDPEEIIRQIKIREGPAIVHRTGDLGYFDGEGRLWYCGRKSHRVETAAGTLFSEQLEGIFNAHPLVYRTALVGVDQEPLLWVETAKNARRGDQPRIKRELAALAKNHPQASQIRRFLFMQRFPTDVRHNSKIIRETLTVKARAKLA